MIDVDGFVVYSVLDCLVQIMGKAFLFELQRLFCSLPFGFACKIVSIYLVVDVVDVVDVLDCLILNVWNIVVAPPPMPLPALFISRHSCLNIWWSSFFSSPGFSS